MAKKSLLDYALDRKGKMVNLLGSGLSSRDEKSINKEIDVISKEIDKLMLQEYGPKVVKKAKGGSVKKNLKPVPEGNKGLGKLPTEVRNKMGFMEKGGQVAGPKKYTKKKKPKSFVDLIKFSDTTGKEYQKDKVTKSGKRLGGFKKGGLVKGGTSSQMTGKEYKGTF